MSSLRRELVFLILQFLDEEKFKEAVHKLEQESWFFFNMKYFEDQVQAGEWEEVERYLSGFTKVEDNRYSMKIFFEIRKQKYLEALDKQDRAKAVEILVKDLRNEQLSKYGDTKSACNIMLVELKKLIEANPLFRDKLTFSVFKASRLRTLINQRLFSCGTSKEGESHLVEWNESEGAIKRAYSGFRKRSLGVVQFDTTRDRFLAAGDEFQIKFWDMDNTNILTCIDCDGGLHASPRLRFNKEGSLLAVTTSDNGIKILANIDGQRMLRMIEARAFDGPRGISEAVNVKIQPSTSASPILERNDRVQLPMSLLSGMESGRLADVKPRVHEAMEKLKTWKSSDISDPSQLKNLKLPDPLTPSKVVRLMYTNSGLAVLALASNAIHKLWKWQRNERNPSESELKFPWKKVKTKLKGHQKLISGLAFSQSLNILVSSGADAQLCVWSIDGWEKKKSRIIQAPPGQLAPLVGETRVQFHNNQSHLLVVHESQVAIYDSQLECLRAWYPRDSLSSPVSSAIYSCDGQMIFTGFCDGAVGIFDSDSLNLRCRIAPSAYIPTSISSGNPFPVVIAAHPSDINQFALGMSDGGVHVIEPSDTEAKWGGAGGSTSQENGALTSVPSSSALNAHPPSETPSR
ncbi:Topless-related protein 1 [Striga hermonthica]|uniref:Topless-related protein 1 n=1 Tax=Striga hermonthica TaxID=68872 RepID=A0A9N7NWV7_STRHE|nr:Topless-related protein 1 [Striga hermonthica]